MKKRSKIAGLATFQPAVNQLQQLLRAFARMILGNQKQILAAFGIFGQPFGHLEFVIAIAILGGGVEIANAQGPAEVEVFRAVGRNIAAQNQHAHFRAVPSQLPGGHRRGTGGGSLGRRLSRVFRAGAASVGPSATPAGAIMALRRKFRRVRVDFGGIFIVQAK